MSFFYCNNTFTIFWNIYKTTENTIILYSKSSNWTYCLRHFYWQCCLTGANTLKTYKWKTRKNVCIVFLTRQVYVVLCYAFRVTYVSLWTEQNVTCIWHKRNKLIILNTKQTKRGMLQVYYIQVSNNTSLNRTLVSENVTILY